MPHTKTSLKLINIYGRKKQQCPIKLLKTTINLNYIKIECVEFHSRSGLNLTFVCKMYLTYLFFFLRKNFKCINVKMISEPIATPLGIGW